MIKKFRIICLKRSEFRESIDFDYTSDWYKSSKIVYWKDNRSGYTEHIEEAGEYAMCEISRLVAGSWMDWLLEPTWR